MDRRAHAVVGAGVAIASLALTGGGCSLLVDTDGLSTSAASPADGGFVDSDAENQADATKADANDGAPAPTNRCAASIHCETFDEGDPLSRHTKSIDSSTIVTIDDTRSVSAPRSARFVINPSGNGSPDATLTFHTDAAVASFVFEGTIYIEREEPSLVGRILRLGNTTNPAITLDRSGTVRLEGTGVLGTVSTMPSGQWVTLRLELRPNALTVTVNGTGPAAFAFPITWAKESLTVRFGISEASSPTTGWVVNWDNLVVREL